MSKPTKPGVYAVMRPRNSPNAGLTAGKYYVADAGFSDRSFRVTNDEGARLFCLWEGCAHLGNRNWRKVVVE